MILNNLLYPYTLWNYWHNAIFIHIPKNGGTSILKALNMAPRRLHLPWYIYRQANKSFYDKAYKFAVIRDPLERLLSAYAYFLTGGNATHTDKKIRQYLLNLYPTIIHFSLNYTFADCMHIPHFMPQSFFVTNYYGELEADLLLIDHLDDKLKCLSSKLNIKNNRKSLKKLNASSYSSDWDLDELKENLRSTNLGPYSTDYLLYKKASST